MRPGDLAWLGYIIAFVLGVVVCLFATSAFAYGPHTWRTSAMSELTMTEVDDKNCPAEILIENRQSDYLPELTGTLEVAGIVVVVNYALNVDLLGAESYAFLPPDGYIAMPPDVVVQDDHDFTVKICKFVGF